MFYVRAIRNSQILLFPCCEANEADTEAGRLEAAGWVVFVF